MSIHQLPDDLLLLILQKNGIGHVYKVCTLVSPHWYGLIWNHPSTGLFYRCWHHFENQKTLHVPGVQDKVATVALFFFLWVYPEHASRFFVTHEHERAQGFPTDYLPSELRKLLSLKRGEKESGEKITQITFPAQHLVRGEHGRLLMTVDQYYFASGVASKHEVPKWAYRSVRQAQYFGQNNYLFAAMFQICRQLYAETRERIDMSEPHQRFERYYRLRYCINAMLKQRRRIPLSFIHSTFRHHPDYRRLMKEYASLRDGIYLWWQPGVE